MKNIIKIFTLMFAVVLFSGCYDRDIIDSKELDYYSLPNVENLAYTKTGNTVKLTWQIPTNISDNFKRPLEVKIRIVENNIYKDMFTIENEHTSGEFTIPDPGKNYRVIVKLFGFLKDDVRETGRSGEAYSEGITLEIK